MSFFKKFLVAVLASPIILSPQISRADNADSKEKIYTIVSEQTAYSHSSARNINNYEMQYARKTESNETMNSVLLTRRNSMGRRNGIIELDEYRGKLGIISAGYFDVFEKKIQLRGFAGSDDLKSDDRFAGVHGRVSRLPSETELNFGYEKSSSTDMDISALFGYEKSKIHGKLPVDLELLGGIGNIKSGDSEQPYGFYITAGKNRCGLGIGITKTGDDKKSTTRNFSLFRHASFNPKENKYPTFFAVYRDNPENEKSFLLLGIYHGKGIDGSWQLVEPAVYGISQGMFTRTLAHPDQNIGKAARFNDVGNFSRDSEDGTIVILGADYEQELGMGLKVAVREIDFHYTLYKGFGLISNPHIGVAAMETTNPYFDPKTHSMENETTRNHSLIISFNLLDKYIKKHGLRIGAFSDLTFVDARTDNTCGLYFKGVNF